METLQRPLLQQDNNHSPSLRRLRGLAGLSRAFRAPVLREAESLDYDQPGQSAAYHARLEDSGPEIRHIYGYTGHTLGKFIVTVTTGLVVGLLAVALVASTEHLLYARNAWIHSTVLQRDSAAALGATASALWHGYAVYLCFSLSCVLVAASLVQVWAMPAAGAGVSLVMAYLNGNDIPELLQLRTLIVKFVGTALGCASSLPLGPEGPMVHLGAAVAAVITHAQYAVWSACSTRLASAARAAAGRRAAAVKPAAPLPGPPGADAEAALLNGEDRTSSGSPHLPLGADAVLRRRGSAGGGVASEGRTGSTTFAPLPPFRETVPSGLVTNKDLREFVSAGASAGLAGAFGAPIGGVLFSMEEACSYWSRKVAWRCFVCAAVATFTIAQLHPRWQSGMLSFAGNMKSLNNGEWLVQLPLIVVVAAASGLLGALFNSLRRWLWRVRASRRRHLLRIGEALLCTLMIASWMYLSAQGLGVCQMLPEEWSDGSYGLRFNCGAAQYNDLATLYWSPPTETIRKIFSLAADGNTLPSSCFKAGPCYFTIPSLAIASVTSMLGMSMASGMAVPGGLFMPSIMVGSSFGAMYGLLLLQYAPPGWAIQPGLYAIVAATAVLGGVFQSSISLVVIVVEGTRGINFLFGIIIAVVISNWIAHLIHSEGVYESELERDGNVNYLRTEPPHALRLKTAEQVMSRPVIGFNEVEREEHVRAVLSSSSHHGFPVYSHDSACAGSGEGAKGLLEGLALRSQLLVLLQVGVYCDEEGRYLDTRGLSPAAFEAAVDEAIRTGQERYRAKSALSLRRTAPPAPGTLPAELPVNCRARSSMDGGGGGGANGGARAPSFTGNGYAQYHGATNGCTAPAAADISSENGGSGEAKAGPASALVHACAKAGGVGGEGCWQPRDAQGSGRYLNLRPFMNRAPLAIRREASATRAHELFVSLSLRHLCVVDGHNRVVGLITRKDLDRAAGQGWWRKTRIAPNPPHDAPGLAEGWMRRWYGGAGDMAADDGTGGETQARGLSGWMGWPILASTPAPADGDRVARSQPTLGTLQRLISPQATFWNRMMRSGAVDEAAGAGGAVAAEQEAAVLVLDIASNEEDMRSHTSASLGAAGSSFGDEAGSSSTAPLSEPARSP